MLSEATDQHPAMKSMIHLYVPNVDAVYQRAVAAGGKSFLEPIDQFYGDRTAGVHDPSGCAWYIATHIKDVSMADLKKRAAEMQKQQKGKAA
jgi:PhnB protein